LAKIFSSMPAPSDAPAAPAPSSRDALLYAAALALVALFHLPSLGFGFLAWDDDLHVTENPLVLTPLQVPLREHLTTPSLGYPIPVTVATYTLQAALTGVGQAWPFHLVNVLLHVACAALVLGIALRLGLGRVGALVAVFVYGLHPVVAEPVSWVSGRKDLLAGLFGLGCVWLAFPRNGGVTRARRAASIACYALAVLSKPSAAPVFLLVPLLQWLAPEPTAPAASRAAGLRRAFSTALPYALVLAPVLVLGIVGQQAVGAVASAEREGASWLRSVTFGLGQHMALLLFWEEPTAKYLPTPWPPPAFVPRVDLAPLMLLAGIALALWRLPKVARRVALFATVWSVLGYLPSSGVIPLSRQFADSYVYLPLIGFAWLLGAAADALAQRGERAGLKLLAYWPFALAIVLALRLLPSAARFHDDEALWAHARARYPHSARVCRQWANGVAAQRGPGPGLTATDECIAGFGDGLFVKNRGVLLFQNGRFAEARTWLARAREASPNDAVVARYLAALAAAPPQPARE
jgi:hypothetical protein